MNINKNQTSQCVKVLRVFDWINKTTDIKLKKLVHFEDKTFDDLICSHFCIQAGDIGKYLLWTTYGINQIGGSICINFTSGNGNSLVVFVNSEKRAELKEGNSFSGTFTQLDSIEVKCNGENANSCYGEFKIMFHFSANDDRSIKSIKDIKKTICYLSDCNGNPFSLKNGSLITDLEGGANFHVYNEKGEPKILQRVDLLIHGFVCVQIENKNGEICFQCIMPFSEVETISLCVPNETIIKSYIDHIDCRAHAIPSIHKNKSCIEIIVILTFCLSVQSVDEVIVELEGTICQPRKELNIALLS